MTQFLTKNESTLPRNLCFFVSRKIENQSGLKITFLTENGKNLASQIGKYRGGGDNSEQTPFYVCVCKSGFSNAKNISDYIFRTARI